MGAAHGRQAECRLDDTDPDTSSGPTVSWAYDAAGRLCRRVAANPGVVLQNLATPCSSSVSGASVDTRYTYDAAGNALTTADALATASGS